MSRQASVLVCDEILFSLSGKINALGIYTGDIVIQTEETSVNQLVFLFNIECDLADPYQAITVEVQLPGEEARRMPIGFIIPPVAEGRTRWTIKWPFLIQSAKLKLGKISTKVIHEKGEIDSGGAWIVKGGIAA